MPRPVRAGRKVTIRFQSRTADGFVFLVDGPSRSSALEMMAAENDIFSWLSDNLVGPLRYTITRDGEHRLVVTLARAVDVARFDRTFRVVGLTPDVMLAA